MGISIAVIGATGLVGEPVARRLLADGHTVRVCSHAPDDANARFGDACEVVHCDVRRPESVRTALFGMQGVHVNLHGKTADECEELEHQGTRTVARIAAELGLERLTYTAGISARSANAHFAPSAAKLRAIAAIVETIVPFTIFRPHWFFESLPLFVKPGRAYLLGRQRNAWHWVALADYARMVSTAYTTPESVGQILDIWGPQPVSLAEALTRFASQQTPPIRVSRISLWRASLLATLMGNRELRAAAAQMRFWDRFSETGDPTSANSLLGAPTISFEEWLASRIWGTRTGYDVTGG